jgi:FkbM family methyltransferase
MTRTLAVLMNALLHALTFLLPRWKRLTVRARLYDKMQPFEGVDVDGKSLKLFIPDRTCVYWAKYGPDSEPATNAWIKSFGTEDTFVDIGANIGLYSLMAAAHGASRVYAFEPNPFSFGVLARNICLNGLDGRVVPLCLALSERSSIVTFKLGSMQAGSIGNEIVNERTSGDSKSITMASFSVDELLRIQGISGVNHMKIDVDGLELGILRGAVELLANPVLKSVLVEDNMEMKEGKSPLVAFFQQYGFSQSDAWGSDRTSNRIFTRLK